MADSILSAERLREVFDYARETGCFLWKAPTSTRSRIGDKAGYFCETHNRHLICVEGSTTNAERLAWLYVFGILPDRPIMHRDGNPRNNAISNLMTAPIGRDLTAERLKELFSYDKNSGAFTRRVSVSSAKSGSVAGASKDGYLVFNVDGKLYRAHRLAWLYVFGRWPKKHLDHINGIRNDNRIANLREADNSLNMQNLKGPRSDNKVKLLGVCWSKSNKKWIAQIKAPNKPNQYLGGFDDPHEAHAAYLDAKRRIHEGCAI